MVLSALTLGNNYEELGKLRIPGSFWARCPGGEVFLMLPASSCGIIAAALRVTLRHHNTVR
jgi:hypothetical protein